MIYPKIPLAQSILQICEAKGIQNIIISPGSRNAPLTIGFVNNPYFKCYSIADERCADFFAMGIAQQIKKPVAVICTSGSAVLNFYPAFAEAFYSQIPLIVISADRPADKIDIGDGQTIRQENVFANHSLYNANLTIDASSENDFLINEAINTSILQKGPVHINAPFEEPLYEVVESPSVSVTISEINDVKYTISPEEIRNAADMWNSATRKLILIGVNEPGTLNNEILDSLANDPSVVVMTESTSNISHPKFINHIDRIITPFSDDDFLEFQPEIVLTLGGMVVSKRIKSFLRKYPPKYHWHVDTLRAYNTFGVLSHHYKIGPFAFFNQILPLAKPIDSDYSPKILAIKKYRIERHNEFLKSVDYSDFKVFSQILPTLPDHSQLHISNSASIRYAQLFEINSSVEVFCNRGTSGIDGSTSTAIGAASANNKPTVLITGDVSFFYDSNALWNKYIPKDFKIIIVNNGGGGIFRILPGHQENEVFNTYFETSHQLTAIHLAKMYGFTYFQACDETSLTQSIADFYHNNERPCILEIMTPTLKNDKILLDYFKKLS